MQWQRLAAACLLAAPLATGCSVNQQVSLGPGGSGTAAVHIRLEKIFMDYIRDLAEVGGQTAKDKDRPFNVEEIRKSFASREGVEVRRVESPSKERLDLELGFLSLEDLFAGDPKVQAAGLLTVSRKAGLTTVKIHLDRTNFPQLLELAPFLKNPLFAGLGPQENDNTTEQEYYQMIDLALGEGGAAALKASSIETTINIQGKLVSQTGGTATADGVVFRIPLIRVLLLDKPLDFSIAYAENGN
jgi:hypothetical protein